MQIILFDTALTLKKLYPFSFTRPVCHIRHGLFSLREWYAIATGFQVHSLSSPFFHHDDIRGNQFLCVDSAVIPDKNVLKSLLMLGPGEALEDNNGLIGYVTVSVPELDRLPLFFKKSTLISTVARINHPIDWVKTNASKLLADFQMINASEHRLAGKETNQVFGTEPVFMAEGARANGAIFNTEEGAVYIGKNAIVMEGACIRGPVAIAEGAVVKMGAQVYPGTTIGKMAVAGGEIKNSIIGDYSNKAHHGYMGDSMIGRWCNLGAGTTNSNVKNNAGEVFLWDNRKREMIPVGMKAGFLMGDYSKTAINTTINTGTTIGVCCSIHQPGFHEKHIHSFSWGPGKIYEYEKALRHLDNWFKLKNQPAEEGLPAILEHIFKTHKSS